MGDELKVTQAEIDAAAQHMAKEESHNCKTLDAALLHRENWRRLRPEAEAILRAARNTRTETQSQATGRFITLWRKPAPDNLDWDFHISEDTDDLQQVLADLKKRDGIWQITTYRLGEKIESFADAIAKAGGQS